MSEAPSSRQRTIRDVVRPTSGHAWATALAEMLGVMLVLMFGLQGWHSASKTMQEQAVATLEAESARLLSRIDADFDALASELEQDIARARLGQSGLPDIGWSALLDHLAKQPVITERRASVLAAALPIEKPSTGRVLLAVAAPVSDAAVLSPTSIGNAHVVRDADRIGIDPYHDVAVRSRMMSARDEGRATLHLAAPPPDTTGVVSASLFAPLYAIASPWGQRDRRSHFVGLVVAPFDPEPILASALNAHPRLAVTASVGGAPLAPQDAPSARTDSDADDGKQRLTLSRSRAFLGQMIDFRIELLPPPGTGAGLAQPTRWLLYSAMTVAVLLSLLLVRAARARQLRRCWASRAQAHHARIAELDGMVARLDSFAYVVSHDLKTPLRKMQGLCEALAEELDENDGSADAAAEIDEYLQRLHRQGRDMATLIDGVGEYSRAMSNSERIESVDTRACVQSIAATIGLPSSNLRMTGNFPHMRTTAVRFEQTLANLIGNAWKYHDRQAEALIEVSVSGFGDFWLFAVRDDGPGIDAAHHQRIFDAFESVPVPGVESSGIGLSIVRTAVDSVGGQLTLESAPGKGSTFRFTWPKDSSENASTASS